MTHGDIPIVHLGKAATAAAVVLETVTRSDFVFFYLVHYIKAAYREKYKSRNRSQ